MRSSKIRNGALKVSQGISYLLDDPVQVYLEFMAYLRKSTMTKNRPFRKIKGNNFRL
jgi:hypothetical protein